MYAINVGKNIQLCNDLVCISAMYAGIFMHGHLYRYSTFIYRNTVLLRCFSLCVSLPIKYLLKYIPLHTDPDIGIGGGNVTTCALHTILVWFGFIRK